MDFKTEIEVHDCSFHWAAREAPHIEKLKITGHVPRSCTAGLSACICHMGEAWSTFHLGKTRDSLPSRRCGKGPRDSVRIPSVTFLGTGRLEPREVDRERESLIVVAVLTRAGRSRLRGQLAAPRGFPDSSSQQGDMPFKTTSFPYDLVKKYHKFHASKYRKHFLKTLISMKNSTSFFSKSRR